MDNDHGRFDRNGSQTSSDRTGSRDAPGDDDISPPRICTSRPGNRGTIGVDRARRDDEDDAVTRQASGPHGPCGDRPAGQRKELLVSSEANARTPRHHDRPDGPSSAQGSASLRRTSAVSSSTFKANVNSDTRICRARCSMRFSPADRPLSLSRIDKFRTTSAT